jgi:hypothetical protein
MTANTWRNAKMTSCLRKILMCLVLLAFAWPWLKIRVMFGNDGEGVAARIICGILYGILAVFVAWILCRPKKSAENFNNATTRFFRRPDVAFAMCVKRASAIGVFACGLSSLEAVVFVRMTATKKVFNILRQKELQHTVLA